MLDVLRTAVIKALDRKNTRDNTWLSDPITNLRSLTQMSCWKNTPKNHKMVPVFDLYKSLRRLTA